MSLSVFVTSISLALLAAIVVVRLFKGGDKPQSGLLILSAAVLGLAQMSLLLMLSSRDPERVLVYFHNLLASMIFLPALAIPFFIVFGRKNGREILVGRLPWIVPAAVLLAAAALVVPAKIFVTKIHFQSNGPFWGLEFTGFGEAAAAYLLLANVAILTLFENTYRNAIVPDRVTFKYPLLGLILSSIINFAVMSKVLAIAAVDRNFLAIHSCGIIMLAVSFLYASIRYPLLGVQVYVSPKQPPSTFSIVVAGLYLLSLGLITLLARIFGLPFGRFTMTILGIFAAFILIAVLISGKAKKRLRTFISENFTFSRYNYRKEWRRYAEIMASGGTVDDFLSNVASSLCDTMLVRRGVVWADVGPGKTGFHGFPEETIDHELIKTLQKLTARESVYVFRKPLVELARPEWKWVHAMARLGQGDECRGLIVLGEKELGRSFTGEDEDFLATIAFQAKLALDGFAMEERLIESRQMESFNRFASFVIHDLKNTTGMLSLVAENARDNIGNADFQRDALDTIRRSVDKMQKLITSLSVHRLPTSLKKIKSDVVQLIETSTNDLKPAASKKGVALQFIGGIPARATIDPSAIQRVVENLILNAIEATPAGGAVRVEAEMIDDVWTRITVKDSGPGFDPDYLRDRLFHPFHSTKKDGLGIGLILCKSLIEAHGGRISIASAPGSGAAVTVTLPAEPSARGG